MKLAEPSYVPCRSSLGISSGYNLSSFSSSSSPLSNIPGLPPSALQQLRTIGPQMLFQFKSLTRARTLDSRSNSELVRCRVSSAPSAPPRQIFQGIHTPCIQHDCHGRTREEQETRGRLRHQATSSTRTTSVRGTVWSPEATRHRHRVSSLGRATITSALPGNRFA